LGALKGGIIVCSIGQLINLGSTGFGASPNKSYSSVFKFVENASLLKVSFFTSSIFSLTTTGFKKFASYYLGQFLIKMLNINFGSLLGGSRSPSSTCQIFKL